VLRARDEAGAGKGNSSSNSSSSCSSSTRLQGRRRNDEEEEEGADNVLERGAIGLNIPSADAPQQQSRRGNRPPTAGQAKLVRREDEEEDHQATPFQRLLKTSSSLVSSAVKGVMGLMSPREEHARRNGSGEMSRNLVASLGDDWASPSARVAVMNGMKPKTPASASTAWAPRMYIAYAGDVDDDGAVELPPSWTDGAAEEGGYEGQPVDSITVSELRKILRLKGLSYKGKKSELADRLKEWLRFEQQQQSQQQPPASRLPPATCSRSRSPSTAPAPSSPARHAATLVGHANDMPVVATAKVTGDDHHNGNSTSSSSSSSGQRQSPAHHPAWMQEDGEASLPRPLVPVVKPVVTRGVDPSSERGLTTISLATRGGGGVEESKSSGSGGTVAASRGSGREGGQRGVEEVYGVINTFLNKKGSKARIWDQRGRSPVPLPSSAGFVASGAGTAQGGGGGRDGEGVPRYKRSSIASNMTPFSAAAAVASSLQDEMPDLNFMSDGNGGDGGGRQGPLSNGLTTSYRSQQAQARVSSSLTSFGGRTNNSHSVRFAQQEEEEDEQKGGGDSRATASRFRTTPSVDRSRPPYATGGVGGSISLSSSGRKRGSVLESADATRFVRPRQAPRAPSRWSDLVTRRILNSMQEQMRTPMQDAKSQFVPTPLRSRALPAREVGEVSPPRQGMSAMEEQYNDHHQEQQQRQQQGSRDGAGAVQPSRLTGAGRDKRRRQDQDEDDDEGEEEKHEEGRGGEPGVFKLPRHSLLPEPRPVFGVEAAEIAAAAAAAAASAGSVARMEENGDFAFTAPQVMLLDEEEEREVEAAAAQHHEEFIFTPPVKRRLRPRRADQQLQQQQQQQQQQKQQPSLLRPPATSVPAPASMKKDADRAAMPPPQPRQGIPVPAPAPPADTKPSTGSGGGGWGDLQARLQKPGSWKCDGCLSTNIDAALLKCPSCESPKPGSASSAPPSVSPAPTSATAFATTPVPAAALTKTSMPTFGMGSITSQGFNFGGGGSGVAAGGGAAAEPKTTEGEGVKDSESGDKAKGRIAAGPTFEGEKGGGAGEGGMTTSQMGTKCGGFTFDAAPTSTEKKHQEKQKEKDGGESKEEDTDQAASASVISPFVFGASTSNVVAGKEKEAAVPAPKLPSFTFGGLPSSSTAAVDSSANGGDKDTAKTTSTTPAPSTPSFTFGGTGTAGGAATFTAPSFGTFEAPTAQTAPVMSKLFPTAASSASSESVPTSGPVAFPPVSLAPSKPSSAGSTGGSLFANVPSILSPLSGTSAVADQPTSVIGFGSATSTSTAPEVLKSTPSLPAFPTSLPASSSGSITGTGAGLPSFTFGAAPAPAATAPGGLSSFSFSSGGTTATQSLKPSGSGGGLGSVPSPGGGSMDMSASPRLSPAPTPAASASAFSSAPPSFQFGSHGGSAKPPLFGATPTPAAPASGFGAGVGIGAGSMGAAPPSGLTSTAPTFGAASPAPMFGASATSTPAAAFGQPAAAPAGGMFGGPPSAPGGMAGGFGASSEAPSFGGFGASAAGVGGISGFGALPAPGGDAFSLGASSSQQQPGGRKIIKARRPVRK